MKKVSTKNISLFLFCFFIFGLAVNIGYAQSTSTLQMAPGTVAVGSSNGGISNYTQGSVYGSPTSITPAGGSQKTTIDCSLTSVFSASGIDECLALGGSKILAFTSLILWAVGILFNYVLDVTVIHMATTLFGDGKTNMGITGINIAWKVFRDLSNILFIFVLLYISIGTILGTIGSNGKSLLKNLIIAAILINFSLFFTKVVVDASNIFALQFYQNISVNGQPINIATGSSQWNTGLASAFVQAADLTSIYSDPNAVAAQNGGTDSTHFWKIFVATIMGSVFILVAAFAFFAATLIFVYRFIVIVMLMILSPLAFAANILPDTAQYWKKWTKALTSEVLVAPVFFMMIWVVLKIVGQNGLLGGAIGGISTASQTAGFAAFAGGNTSVIGIILNFCIVIGFLYMSIALSKSVGGYGGDAALKLFDRTRKGTQAILGRNTVGRAASSVANSSTMRNFTANNPFLGRALSAPLSSVAGAGFGGKKGGYTQQLKDQKKAIVDASKNLEKDKYGETLYQRANKSKYGEFIKDEKGKRIGTIDFDGRVIALDDKGHEIRTDKDGKALEYGTDAYNASTKTKYRTQKDAYVDNVAKDSILHGYKFNGKGNKKSRANREAAQEMRKGKKDVKATLEELLEAEGEKPKKDDKPAAAAPKEGGGGGDKGGSK